MLHGNSYNNDIALSREVVFNSGFRICERRSCEECVRIGLLVNGRPTGTSSPWRKLLQTEQRPIRKTEDSLINKHKSKKSVQSKKKTSM